MDEAQYKKKKRVLSMWKFIPLRNTSLFVLYGFFKHTPMIPSSFYQRDVNYPPFHIGFMNAQNLEQATDKL